MQELDDDAHEIKWTPREFDRPIDPSSYIVMLERRRFERCWEQIEAREEVQSLLDRLETAERSCYVAESVSGRVLARVVRLRLAGATLAQVGSIMGRSVERICELEQKAKNRLRILARNREREVV